MPDDEKKKILLVDDEKNILDGIKRQLRKHFDIQTALGGEQGLELIRTAGPFEVIVSDLRMMGMDGLTFLRKVCKISPDSVRVMLTGYGDLEVAVEAVNRGRIFRFLSKPCPPDVLLETLNECIEHYSQLMSVNSYTYTTYLEEAKPVWTDRSHGCLAVTGYGCHDFVKDHFLWLSMVLPEHRPMVKEHITKVAVGDELTPIEFKIRKKDGNIVWVRDTVIPQRNEDGTVYRYDGMVQDITERKVIEEELRQSQERYHRMVANVPGLVYQVLVRADGTMDFLFVSDSVKDIFGLEPHQVIEDGNTLLNKIHPDDRDEFYASMQKSAEQLAPCEWRGRGVLEDNTETFFQSASRPQKLTNGDILWDGILIDITEFRQIEQQVSELAKFPAENPNPVMRVSDDGQIIYANNASHPLLSLWAKKVGDHLPDDMLKLVINAKTSGSHDCVEVHAKDHVFSIVFAPIAEYNYINLYARNVTEVKRAERELLRTNQVLKEHDRLKSEFVSTVSHELRTPLCIFKNIVSNAMAGVMGKVSHKLYESLKMADVSIDRLSRIIADFLDISKIESGSMSLDRTDIILQNTIKEVTDSLQVLASTKGIELKTNAPRQDIVISADRDRIIQILTNLIGNAIKFIPVNGTIVIEITDSSDEVQIAVEDNGPGLSKEDMAKIFDRFVQIYKLAGAGEHGTGLGLTISKELVELHGGRMWVNSAPGQGCCFFFTLSKNLQAARKPALQNQLPSTSVTR